MDKIIKFYNDNKILLITIFCFAILTFGYFGVNTIINNDGVLDLIVNSTSNADHKLYLSVGRWGWALIGSIFKFYPSPFLYMIINAFMFSIAAVYLNKMFKVKNIYKQILVGMILTCFPINIVAYSYSAWQISIGIAILSSILSVYILQTATKKYQYLISILLMAFVTSIYQMFMPLILVLLICITIHNASNKTSKESFLELVKYAIIFIISCILYSIIVKLSTAVFQIDMNSYQNADQMFSFNIKEILDNLLTSFLHCLYPHQTPFYSIVGQGILILTTILSYITCIKKDKNKILIYTFLYFCLLIAPQFLRFFKPLQWFHSITFLPYGMLYATTLAILFKNIDCIKKLEKYIIIIIVFTITIFIIDDNRAGVMAQNSTNAAYQFANRLQYRIESTEGYSEIEGEKKYYFIGGTKEFWEFPYSERAYYHTLGITTNFVFNPLNMVDAINVLGINAKYYNNEIDNETKEIIESLASDRNEYPSLDSVFIYEDIVVIVYNK